MTDEFLVGRTDLIIFLSCLFEIIPEKEKKKKCITSFKLCIIFFLSFIWRSYLYFFFFSFSFVTPMSYVNNWVSFSHIATCDLDRIIQKWIEYRNLRKFSLSILWITKIFSITISAFLSLCFDDGAQTYSNKRPVHTYTSI